MKSSRLAWLGVCSLTLSWLFALPLYERPGWAWVPLLVVGVALNCLAFRGAEYRTPPAGAFVIVFSAAAAAAFVLSWPHKVGALMLLAAVAAAMFGRRLGRAAWVVPGFGVSALVLLLQALAWPAYAHFAARLHRVPVLDYVFAFVVRVLGGGAAASREGMFVQTSTGVQQFYTTWEALGAYVLVNVLLGGVVVLLLARRFWDDLFRLCALLLAYGAVRYTLLLFCFASFETADIFWLRSWLLASFLPLAPLLMWLLPLEWRALHVPSGLFARRPLTAAGLGSAAAALLLCVVLVEDPGVRKQGRVLFDEGHSNWEWMERAYDTEWYGEQSGYNYYSLGQYLRHYYQLDIKRETLTPELLKNYDVLVLKTPTSPYSPAEVRAVVEYVERGGGLWLIGDHTNVFGMGTYLNPVANAFGFGFKFDATYDLPTGELTVYEPPAKANRHPVANHLPFYMFATSCSLDAPLLSDNVMLGYGVKGAQADYSQKSFFPKDAHATTAIEFGLLVQSSARKFGRGRVLLYTDSTCFSNFYMFMPGKPELVLGSVEWLNRSDRFGWARLLLLAIACAAAAGAFFAARGAGRRQFFVVVPASVLLTGSAVVSAAGWLNARAYARPTPHTNYPTVAFDAEHSKFFLPVKQLKPKATDRGPEMHTFYVWTQRLGIVPEVRYEFTECLEGRDAVVVINPEREFTAEEVSRFVSYVEGGGKALVIDDPRNKLVSSAHQLLQPFGLRIDYRELHEGVIEDEARTPLWPAHHAGGVTGGEPLLYVRPPTPGRQGVPGAVRPASAATTPAAEPQPNAQDPRRPVLASVRRGQGVLVVMANANSFSTEVMGSTGTVPDERVRRVYELEYRIFRDILGVAAGRQNLAMRGGMNEE